MNFSHARLKQQQQQNFDKPPDLKVGGTLTPDLQPSSPPSFPKQPFPVCTVGRYLLFDQLDVGHHHLYKCVNIDTQEELTCKIVNNEVYQSTLSAYLRVDSHEHINEITEVLVGSRHSYIFFPRSYGDLHSHVRMRRRLREHEAMRLFRQVASAVYHCHENGIVLRDLKLRKFVFKDPEKTLLKLETLEDAVVVDDDDQLNDKHGCPAYVSPEILMTNGSYSGKASDMWSLGVMLYTMLVGRYPFHDSEASALFSKIRYGHYVTPDTVSPRAKCLIRSLLRHDPSERLTAHDVLQHPWFNLTVGKHGETRPRLPHPRSCDQIVPEMNGITAVAFDGIGTT